MPTNREIVPMSIRLHKDLVAQLRQIAREQSFKQSRDVTYSVLVEEALLKAYPTLKKPHAV